MEIVNLRAARDAKASLEQHKAWDEVMRLRQVAILKPSIENMVAVANAWRAFQSVYK